MFPHLAHPQRGAGDCVTVCASEDSERGLHQCHEQVDPGAQGMFLRF